MKSENYIVDVSYLAVEWIKGDVNDLEDLKRKFGVKTISELKKSLKFISWK